jgi:phosphohistidine swiveling domain-containing protein
MIRELDGSRVDAARAGNKAANLARVSDAGFDVPDGFVVPSHLDLRDVSDAELLRAIARIGGFPVAVRSSGTAEDLEGASFAGQYETFLDISDAASLRSRVAACKRSGDHARVRAYAERRGVAGASSVAVLVQRMVRPRVAGVAFTIHPMTGREEHALVECVAGLGDKLVAGEVTPTRIVIDLRTGLVVDENAGGDGAVLSRTEARTLARRLLSVQALFGAPQDIEWAIDGDGRVWILQSRPIAQIAWRTDEDELTNADFKDGGISARVCTPLMFSLYEEALQPTMQRYFESLHLAPRGGGTRWISRYYGRAYWNASAVKRALSKVPGFDERKFDRDLGIDKTYGPSGPIVVPTTAATIARALPVAVALERSYLSQLGEVRRFAQKFPIARRTWLARAGAFAITCDRPFFDHVVRVLRQLHVTTEQTYFTTIYNNANAQSDFKSFVAGMDAAIGGTTSVVHLLGGLADVHHMDLQRAFVRLRAIAEEHGARSEQFDAELAKFVRDHGFHADAELDLTCPRWSEDPERVRAHVENMLRSGAPPCDPDATVAALRRAYEAERESVLTRIRARLSFRIRFAPLFLRHLKRVREYLSAREAMRELSTQTYAIVRAYVVEAGKRLAARGDLTHPDHVFMLERDELVDLAMDSIRGDALAERILYRLQMFEGYRNVTPPNELGAGVRAHEESGGDDDTLHGVGCSPGQVEGTVRVLRSLDDVHELRSGDILVARFTDPGWTPALGVAAGVVTEVGGMLSHAAVIGREYGIPAVLNVNGATKALRSGQRVRIDGARGTVELLDQGLAA